MPHLDGSYGTNTGLRRARRLLLHMAELGLPAATEPLAPVVPQYIAELIRWTAISQHGNAPIVCTTGNPDGHLVLRVGKGGPSYGPEAVAAAAAKLAAEGLPARLMVDCSHGNSNKDYRRQGGGVVPGGRAGSGRLPACDGRGAGEPPGGGQPENPNRSQPAHLWPEHHRCLHRPEPHLAVAVRRARQGQLVAA